MADELTRREFVKIGVTGGRRTGRRTTLGAAAPPMPERPLGRTGTVCACSALAARPRLSRRTSTTCRSHHQPRDRPGRQLHRHRGRLRAPARHQQAAVGARRHQPDLHRRGDGQPPQGGLPGLQDRRSHEGRFVELLEQSLKLLHTDHLDLWQLHNVQRDEAARPDLREGRGHRGAHEGPRREDGAVPRHHGSLRSRGARQGHRALRLRHHLMALNPGDAHRLPFQEALLRWPTRRRWDHRDEDPRARPPAQARRRPTMKDAMSYVLTLPSAP